MFLQNKAMNFTVHILLYYIEFLVSRKFKMKVGCVLKFEWHILFIVFGFNHSLE